MNALTTSLIDLPGGAVAIRDSGGDGPLVLFVHGVLVDGRLWDDVWPGVAAAGYRCVLPNLPLGAHRHPARCRRRPDAGRPGSARRRPDPRARRRARRRRRNDSGGAISQVLAAEDPDAVDRLVLTSADALKHFPADAAPAARPPRPIAPPARRRDPAAHAQADAPHAVRVRPDLPAAGAGRADGRLVRRALQRPGQPAGPRRVHPRREPARDARRRRAAADLPAARAHAVGRRGPVLPLQRRRAAGRDDPAGPRRPDHRQLHVHAHRPAGGARRGDRGVPARDRGG